MDLRISCIRTDGGTQPRAQPNWVTIEDYRDAMADGVVFPPVTVFYDGAEYWLADGFHRLAAAKELNVATISADVRQGTCRDAVLYAVGANATHGLRRTNEDKRRAVEILLHDDEWSQWSNREVARRCGVSLDLVNRCRHGSLNESFSDKRTYITKHGTIATMDTANVGKAKKPNAEALDLFRSTPAADNPSEIAALTKLKPDKQLVVAEILVAGQADTVERALRAEKARAREQTRQHNRLLVAAAPPLVHLAGQRYQTIVLDPPWDPADSDDYDLFGRGQPTYATMRVPEIAALPVGELAADNAHCYLWITNRMLAHGFAILEQWQFRYVTTLTWCKPTIGMGYYFRNNTEHVLFGVRGSLDLLSQGEPTWFQAPRTERHSEKPDAFYDLVERCSPGPWLELFSRRERPGWVHWGAEVAPPVLLEGEEVAA